MWISELASCGRGAAQFSLALAGRRFRILVCRGPECGERRGSSEIRDALVQQLGRRGLTGEVDLGWQSCFGRCTQGPNVLVQELAAPRPGERQFLLATMPRGRAGRSTLYNRVSPAGVEDIVVQHLQCDRPVSRLIEPPARSAAGYNAAASSPAGPTGRGEGGEGET
jgi:(2Fe-2S) ferredoxin